MQHVEDFVNDSYIFNNQQYPGSYTSIQDEGKTFTFKMKKACV